MRSLSMFPIALVLAACDQANITVRLTDAPADGLDRVVVDIAGVDIRAEDGSFSRFDFDPPRTIDLAGLRNGRSETLIDNADIEPGRFQAIRLRFDPDNAVNQPRVTRIDGTTATLDYVVDARSVDIDFEIDEMERETLLLDINLRASLLEDDDDLAANRFRFDPVMRAIRDSETASIQGAIAAALINQAGCSPAMYLYSGSNAELTTLSDSAPPLDSRFLDNATIGGATYQFPSLAAGDYTLAFTCDANDDDPESSEGDVEFLAERTVSIDANEAATVDFQ